MGVTATKQLSLSRLPSVLVIQLVRFDALGNKNETPIRVPPTLDIAAHCSKEALPSKPTYELVAVANHMGSRGSGHCTADCRSAVDRQWYSCNDSTVQGSHYQQEPSELPYLLFYRHVE
ncbi:TPA: Ubiquitin carboxyl-terminal hydrolase 25 [Trebouxia sp. C0006]